MHRHRITLYTISFLLAALLGLGACVTFTLLVVRNPHTAIEQSESASGKKTVENQLENATPRDEDPSGSKNEGEKSESASADSSLNEDRIAQITELESQLGSPVQVSWMDHGDIFSAGSLTDSPAWSTSKVPVACAIYKQNQQNDQSANLQAAIRLSDNAAAENLWHSLAEDDATRAQLVTQIFRDTGDTTTTVPSEHTFAGYTIFGQTQWTTANQVLFLSNISNLECAADVKNDMYNVAGNQRWGIGRYTNTAVKGGWGPTRQGGYTVRQMGWITKDGQEIPLAISAQSGSFDAAVNVVDAVAALFF